MLHVAPIIHVVILMMDEENDVGEDVVLLHMDTSHLLIPTIGPCAKYVVSLVILLLSATIVLIIPFKVTRKVHLHILLPHMWLPIPHGIMIRAPPIT